MEGLLGGAGGEQKLSRFHPLNSHVLTITAASVSRSLTRSQGCAQNGIIYLFKCQICNVLTFSSQKPIKPTADYAPTVKSIPWARITEGGLTGFKKVTGDGSETRFTKTGGFAWPVRMYDGGRRLILNRLSVSWFWLLFCGLYMEWFRSAHCYTLLLYVYRFCFNAV